MKSKKMKSMKKNMNPKLAVAMAGGRGSKAGGKPKGTTKKQ